MLPFRKKGFGRRKTVRAGGILGSQGKDFFWVDDFKVYMIGKWGKNLPGGK